MRCALGFPPLFSMSDPLCVTAAASLTHGEVLSISPNSSGAPPLLMTPESVYLYPITFGVWGALCVTGHKRAVNLSPCSKTSFPFMSLLPDCLRPKCETLVLSHRSRRCCCLLPWASQDGCGCWNRQTLQLFSQRLHVAGGVFVFLWCSVCVCSTTGLYFLVYGETSE